MGRLSPFFIEAVSIKLSGCAVGGVLGGLAGAGIGAVYGGCFL